MAPSSPPIHLWLNPSREKGYGLPELRSPNPVGGYADGVRHHQHQAHMDAHVLQALPRQPLKTQPALGSAVEALSRRPEPLIDGPHPIGALHVYTVLHREHLRRVHPPLQLSPGDDVADLQLIQEPEYGLGLQLAVPPSSSTSMHSPSTLRRSVSTSCFSFTFSAASTWPREKPSMSSRRRLR